MHTKPRPKTFTVLAIFSCYAVPFLLGTGLYLFGYGHKNPRSNGQLIQPPLFLNSQQQPSLRPQNAKPKAWQVAVLQPQAKDRALMQSISQRRQALGHNQFRVKLTQLLTDTATSIPHPQWQNQHISTHMLAKIQKKSPSCRYFIIAPQQQLILCYKDSSQPKAIDLDLRKLLKLSRIG